MISDILDDLRIIYILNIVLVYMRKKTNLKIIL
jgi:hypothetical protein